MLSRNYELFYDRITLKETITNKKGKHLQDNKIITTSVPGIAVSRRREALFVLTRYVENVATISL